MFGRTMWAVCSGRDQVFWLAFYVLVIGVALVRQPLGASAQSPPVQPKAHADEQQQPIALEDEKKRENATDLNSPDKHLFKRLFVKRRKEHLEAVKNLQKINSYERQYKMINVLAEKMFDVIESKKILLENYTDADLRNISFSTVPNTKTDLRDAISSVLENAALFGDMVLNLPDVTQRILKTQPKWNSTIRWSFDFLNRTKDLLDKPTLDMLNLVLQELNITQRDPNYFNPNRLANRKLQTDTEKSKKTSSKKEKRKKGPTMTKIEL